MDSPRIEYANHDGVSIAYTMLKAPPSSASLLVIPGFVSNVELSLEDPGWRSVFDRLARFANIVLFDKRGTGLSDRTAEGTDRSLETRMEDARAVLDALGIDRTSILGISEGGPMAVLFAATYPDRIDSLVIYGSSPRVLAADDWPYGLHADFFESLADALAEGWGTGVSADLFSGSEADDRREVQARLERQGASPAGFREIMKVLGEIDVRSVLPTINVPTLVVHGSDDVVPVEAARYVAGAIPSAKLFVFDGVHAPPLAPASLWDEIERFITGIGPTTAPDRALATVLFTDIVDSTARASEVGDAKWRALLQEHDRIIRTHLAHYRGREVKHTGDGFLATFDGPGRAVHCAIALTQALEAARTPIRAGVHTGEIEYRASDIAGITVHIGARVAAQARESEVLVSRTVRDLVAGSGLQFDDRGEHELKGIPERWHLYAASA